MSALKTFTGSFDWYEFLQFSNSFTLNFDFSTSDGGVYKGIRVDHYTFSMYYIVSEYAEILAYRSRFLNTRLRSFKTNDNVIVPSEQDYIISQLTPLEGYIFNAYPISLVTSLQNLSLDGDKYVFDVSGTSIVRISGYDALDKTTVVVNVLNAVYSFNRNTGTFAINAPTDDVIIEIKGVLNAEYVEIILYNNKSEKNRVDKTKFLNKIGTVKGTFRDEVTLTNVDVDIEYDIVDYDSGSLLNINYIYIPTFRRFYFIDEIVFVRKNLITISCSVDVLYTYRLKILELYAFIDRNEFDYNDKLVDTKRVVEQGTDLISFSATVSDFDTLYGAVNENSTNIVINALASDTI